MSSYERVVKNSLLRESGISSAHMYTETASSAPVWPRSSISKSRLFLRLSCVTSTYPSHQPPALHEPSVRTWSRSSWTSPV